MFDKKALNPVDPKLFEGLTRVISSTLLLEAEKRPTLIAEIQDLCAMKKERYISIVLSLLHNFAGHCQSLPQVDGAYSQPGGLIDNALNRAEAALSLFKSQVLLEDQNKWSEDQSLWQYALFSAAILQGIGKLQADFAVSLYDDRAQLLKKWEPLLENFATAGKYYNYEFKTEVDKNFRNRLNLLIAKSLMPASGFTWIASNEKVLAVWLALINEDYQDAGVLGVLLIRANAIAIQRYFNQYLLHKGYAARGRPYGRVGTFNNQPESIESLERQVGIEFIQWFQKGVAEGIIMINKPPLFAVPGGLLMSPEIFKLFVRENPEYKNWQAIQNAFLSLDLATTTPNGEILLKQNAGVVLPAFVSVFNVTTGKQSKISAVEATYQLTNNVLLKQKYLSTDANFLPLLNSKGQWQQNPVPVSIFSLTPGGMRNA